MGLFMGGKEEELPNRQKHYPSRQRLSTGGRATTKWRGGGGANQGGTRRGGKSFGREKVPERIVFGSRSGNESPRVKTPGVWIL